MVLLQRVRQVRDFCLHFPVSLYINVLINFQPKEPIVGQFLNFSSIKPNILFAFLLETM